MELDLSRGLRDLGASADVPPEAVPLAPVAARVRRGRALRTTAVGLAGAAAVLAVAGVVHAAPWEPTPPAATSTPAPAPTVEPTPETTPEPTPDEATPAPPIVGLTESGAVVEIDPASGAVLRTFAADPAFQGPLTLAPDRSSVYLQTTPDVGRAIGAIVRVGLVDGMLAFVDDGRAPALSPDGTRLAFIGDDPENDDDEWRALHVLDLATWERTVIPDDSCGGCPRRIDQPAWSPDGSRLYVAAGFEDGPIPEMDLVVVTPGGTLALSQAPVFTPDDTYPHGEMGFPAFLADGSLAVVSVHYFGSGDAGDGLTSHRGAIETFDTATSTTLGVAQLPALHAIDHEDTVVSRTLDTAAGPDGRLAVVVRGSDGVPVLHLWDGGETLTRLAEGIVAVAW